MKVRIYMFPYYVSVVSGLETMSPRLNRILVDSGMEVQRAAWDGTLLTVPPFDQPSIIRASSIMTCDPADLFNLARERGHMVYYRDMILCKGGVYKRSELGPITTMFLGMFRYKMSLKDMK